MRLSLPEKSTIFTFLQRTLTWFCFSASLFLVLCFILDGIFGIVYYWFHNIFTFRNGSGLFLAFCFLVWSGVLFFHRTKGRYWWIYFGVGMYFVFMVSFCQFITRIENTYKHRASASLGGRMYHISLDGERYAYKALDVYECDPWGMFCRRWESFPLPDTENPYSKPLVQMRVEPAQNMVYIEVDGKEIYSFQP